MGQDALQVICGYPITGQYCDLVRLLTIYLFLFLSYWNSLRDIATVSLGVVMLYSAVSAFHLILLCITGHKGALDFDQYATYITCGVCLFGAVPLVVISVFRDKSQVVNIAWMVLLFAATIACPASLHNHPAPFTLIDGAGRNVTSLSIVSRSAPQCMNVVLPMRSHQSAEIWRVPTAFYKIYDAEGILKVLTGYGVPLTLIILLFCFKKSMPRQMMEKDPLDTRRKGLAALAKITLTLFLVYAIVGEMALAKLPKAENPDAVGRWSPVVALLLLLVIVGLGQHSKPENSPDGIADAECPPYAGRSHTLVLHDSLEPVKTVEILRDGKLQSIVDATKEPDPDQALVLIKSCVPFDLPKCEWSHGLFHKQIKALIQDATVDNLAEECGVVVDGSDRFTTPVLAVPDRPQCTDEDLSIQSNRLTAIAEAVASKEGTRQEALEMTADWKPFALPTRSWSDGLSLNELRVIELDAKLIELRSSIRAKLLYGDNIDDVEDRPIDAQQVDEDGAMGLAHRRYSRWADGQV